MKKQPSEVLNGYGLSYKDQGNDYIVLCPFHQDTNPSLSMNKMTGIYHCWSCGEKGNLVTFVMRIENIEQDEAVKKVYGEKSLKVIRTKQPEKPLKENKLDDRYYEIKYLMELLLLRTKGNNRLRKALIELKDEEEFKPFITKQKLLKTKVPSFQFTIKQSYFKEICSYVEDYYKDKLYKKFVEYCKEYKLDEELRIVLDLLENKKYKIWKSKQKIGINDMMYKLLKTKLGEDEFKKEMSKWFKN